MKLLIQFLIIIAFSFAGELLHYLLPLPIPASIYGIVLLFAALELKVIKVKHIRETSSFLIAVMPVMFIPAAVGLIDAFYCQCMVAVYCCDCCQYFCGDGCFWMVHSVCYQKRKGGKKMISLFQDSVFFGVLISLAAYAIGLLLKIKTGWSLMNPLLISIILVICTLLITGVDYKTYNAGANIISYLLTPATICLAVPLYQQVELLKKNYRAVLIGILSGVLASLCSVLLLALVFHFDHAAYVTFLPKSITTAIGIGVSEELGGHVSVTVVVIIITGVIGNIFAEKFLKLLCIKEPIAKGIAIGCSAHALGTAKAMEMGTIEGAMSSLSIVVCGVMTVIGSSIFAMFM